MSQADLGTAFQITSDVSNFPKLADRLQQQGLLNELVLGRDRPSRGLGSHPAFRVGSTSVIDTSRLYYDGNSQGGIMGGALTGAPDFTQAALGVPGMRYSLLVPRSVDFDQFAALLYPNYPDELVRPLILTLVQMLWDRGEPNGYANRMTTNPLPSTPPHRVLLNVALGDHQVTNFAADVEARTIERVGARAHPRPGTLARRRRARRGAADHELPLRRLGHLLLGHRPGAAGPRQPGRDHRGATAAARERSKPSREDPHGAPRGAPDAQLLISQFLSQGGAITDVCGGEPCRAGSRTGP